MPRASQVEPWLKRMDEEGIYSNFGPLVCELEQRFAEFLSVQPDQVVSVSSATLGIEGAARASCASTWIVPDFTFPATALAILEADSHVIFGDVDSRTWELNPKSVTANVEIDWTTTGLVPVTPFGAPVNLEHWSGYEHVIIDAASSLGSQNLNLQSLPETWSVVFSLHATKVLPAGEGGIVVFGTPEQAQQFRAWSNFGFAGTRISQVPGTNAKMSEIHAAYGLASLTSWDEEQREWKEALEMARRASEQLSLESFTADHRGAHPYWIVQFPSEELRNSCEAELSAQGIGSRRWWPEPLHAMPACRGMTLGYTSSNTAQLCATTLGLPMFRGLTESNVEQVVTVIRNLK
jgi:dTDP-4-amino-4,6-dideoxygalactose transaminase